MENTNNNPARQEKKRCMGCMRLIPEQARCCPYCDYTANNSYNPKALEEQTVLADRYLIGRILGISGEDITYIAYDQIDHVPVKIKEFFPDTICKRDLNSPSIKVFAGCEILFDKYKQEFIDLNRKIGSENEIKTLIPAVNLFEMNHTVYAVFLYADGISFGDFLARNLGDLTWEQVRYLFVPFLKDLQTMHDLGIVHGGISPETILINKDGTLRLTGFCTKRVRHKFGGTTPQLYKGYAAPEQYIEGSAIGTYTDVYGVAAVIYRAVTGTMPPEACTRVMNDNLVSMADLGTNVPSAVSQAIHEAMCMDTVSRIRMISTLLDRIKDIRTTSLDLGNVKEQAEEQLRQEPVQAQAIPQPVIKPKTQQDNSILKIKNAVKEKKLPYGIIAFVATLLVLGTIAGFVFHGLYGKKNDKDNNQSTVSGSVSSVASDIVFDEQKLPSFIGQTKNQIVNDTQYAPYLTFKIVEEFNAEYPAGVIYAQKPDAKTALSSGKKAEVTLYVSKGEEQVEMPKVSGLSVNSARSALDKAGIPYNEVMVYVSGVSAGTVVRSDYNAGDKLNPTLDTVTLFISAEIPQE